MLQLPSEVQDTFEDSSKQRVSLHSIKALSTSLCWVPGPRGFKHSPRLCFSPNALWLMPSFSIFSKALTAQDSVI